ncbi:MAG: looped-hinge helix DNA binding domain, AbrB family [Halonotius sp. J07HN6]|jgi:looped-hinge helix DNA binding domain, AbrB family|nr:MAG: looped-hinge helix DNA binding domain, AbrB family [Halonotius sp. J07HN6]
MATVDSKGRIVLPKEIRDRLDITPGTEVTIRESDGKAVVDPESDPAEILDRMDDLIAAIDADPEPTPVEELDPHSKSHLDAIQRQAAAPDSSDDE